DPFSAMITVFSHSLSLMVFTRLKVPVSSSQAIVGAVLGIGLLRGSGAVSFRTLGKIFVGWILTPVIGGTIAFILLKIFI
ncbi:MAG TPA: inorganic phosphate transporter, partial [bacterium]|nr:inorganic phosphate transporter [bacterium]